MRQSSSQEAEGDPFALNILLADTTHDLGDINVASLGARVDHILQPIGVDEAVDSKVASFVSSVIQVLVDLGLKALLHRFSGLRLQLARVRVSDELPDISLVSEKGVSDSLGHLLLFDYNVLDSNSEA